SLVKDGTTTVDNTTHAALGDQTHDTSSVSGQVGTFNLARTDTYSPYTCTACTRSPSTTDTESVTSSGTVTASSMTAGLATGGYSCTAWYAANGNYSGSSGGCDPLSFPPRRSSDLSLVKDGTTTVDNTTHAALGDQTHDTSSVSGQVGTF